MKFFQALEKVLNFENINLTAYKIQKETRVQSSSSF